MYWDANLLDTEPGKTGTQDSFGTGGHGLRSYSLRNSHGFTTMAVILCEFILTTVLMSQST